MKNFFRTDLSSTTYYGPEMVAMQGRFNRISWMVVAALAVLIAFLCLEHFGSVSDSNSLAPLLKPFQSRILVVLAATEVVFALACLGSIAHIAWLQKKHGR